MKQVTQNYRSGKIRVEEVDTPALRRGGVLVRTAYSLVSTGTEGMKAREGKMSVLAKARARPDQVKKVLESVQQQGLMPTYRKVINRLDSLTPLGYSMAGTVVAVGKGVTSLRVGQRVACAGVGYANHAEIDFVPENLVVPIPEGVSLPDAASTTVGAIAMQSVRQANLQVGETACVIGLGLIGQLLVQILRAAGVRVIGVDLAQHRCDLATRMGAQAALTPSDPGLKPIVDRMTDGHGVDGIFLAAGGSSNGPVELAVSIARDRAVVVDIGKMKLDLPWNDYYMKELTVRFSRSYGPGRYDPNYEEKGIDYPIGYVRWTERRNMASFLNLIAEGKIDMSPLVGSGVPLEQASEIYDQLTSGQLSDVGVLFQYNADSEVAAKSMPRQTSKLAASSTDRVRIGAVGAGNYASSMLFPHLKSNQHADLVEVVTSSSLSAQNAAQKFGFQRTSTDSRSLFNAPDVDLVIIATRHASHARLVQDGLRQNKAVFVEKPLAIDFDGVESVRRAIVESGNDRLLVGFNRRYAPLVRKLHDLFIGKRNPLVMNYRVHAGQMGADAWYLDPDEGSRFVGEAGHFLDVFAYLTDAAPVRVVAAALGGQNATADDATNIAMTVQYSDGSIGNLTYLTQGGARLPKEYIEVHGGGQSACLQNFESLEVFDARGRKRHSARSIDKGQSNQIDAMIAAIHAGNPLPISAQSLIDTTLATLAAERSAMIGQSIELADLWDLTADDSADCSDRISNPSLAADHPERSITASAELD